MSTLLRRQLEASLAHEKIQVGFREIDCPFDGGTVVGAVNINTDMVERLSQRGKIDHAQYMAGRYFLALVEKAEGSSFLVPDMAREPVDCSIASYAIPDFRLDAQTQLIRVARYLGSRDYRLARRYLAFDPEAYECPESRSEREYHSRRLRDILEDLAAYWGFTK